MLLRQRRRNIVQQIQADIGRITIDKFPLTNTGFPSLSNKSFWMSANTPARHTHDVTNDKVTKCFYDVTIM